MGNKKSQGKEESVHTYLEHEASRRLWQLKRDENRRKQFGDARRRISAEEKRKPLDEHDDDEDKMMKKLLLSHKGLSQHSRKLPRS